MQDGQDAGQERDLPALAAWIVCLLLVGAWGAYLASTLDAVMHAEQADEKWYLHYASEVASRGLGVFPELFERYLGDAAAQRYPNPLRVLFIAVSGAWCAVFGASFAALSALSLCCHLLTALVTFAAARAPFGRARSIVLASSVACSPLLSGLARRALMDSFATLTMALAIWSFLAWTRALASRKRAGLFALALTAALTTKESNLLFVPAFAACLAWAASKRSKAVPWWTASAAIGGALLVAGCAFALAAGGVEPVARMGRIVLASQAANTHAIRFGSGPWYRYLIDFLALSPWVTLAGLGGAAAVLLGRVARGRDDLELLVVFAALALAMFALLTKNVRYLAVLELPLRALAVAFAFELVAVLGARAALAAALALGALACALDVSTFQAFFITNELYDPFTTTLLRLREIVPIPSRK